MRTHLRELQALSLGALAFYFVLAYRVALGTLGVAELPEGTPSLPGLTWLGRWKMFTDLRATHHDVLVEVQVAGAWAPVDLAARYPTRWDEGPGWLRDDYYRDAARLQGLAATLCTVEAGATEVRFTEVRWPKTLGQVEQPRHDEVRTPLGSWPCR